MLLRWVCYHCLKFALALAQSNLPTLLFMQHVLLNAPVTPEASAAPVSACTLSKAVPMRTWCKLSYGVLQKGSVSQGTAL